MSSLSLKAKIFATVAAVGSATAVAGLGTFGTFTDTTSASTAVDTGVVNLDIGAPGAANRLTVAATDIVPGDTMQRAFTLDAVGTTSPLGSVKLTSTAPTSSLLNTDPASGLQMVIEKCVDTASGLVNGWVESVTAPYTYTCAAGVNTRSTVLNSRPVIGSAMDLTNLRSLSTAGAADNLVMTLTLPSTAGNTFQNLASTILFTFDATQRAAESK